MTKDEAIAKMKEKGADDALNLRGRASTMDGTAISAAMISVPVMVFAFVRRAAASSAPFSFILIMASVFVICC